MKIFHRVRIWVRVIEDFTLSLCCVKKADLLSSEKTIDEIINNQTSLIRMGDGELKILEGKGISYQDYSDSLRSELSLIIDTYLEEKYESGYILAMPNEFLKCNGLKLIKKRVWVSCWSHFRRVFKERYDQNIIYGDAFIFSKKYLSYYSEIWKGKSNILFLHNDDRYAKSFEKEYGKKVDFIKVPNNNAYSVVDDLCQKIAIYLTGKNKYNTIVLISAGPCAKVIVYRLRNLGFQIIDTGHCWDDPLNVRG